MMGKGPAGPQPRVACIVPAWNEQDRIGAVIQAMPWEILDLVVVVDDGSTDLTAQRAAEAGAKVVRHKRNRGLGAAIRTGYEVGLAGGYDIVVVMNGAGKTPPGQIPRLLDPILAGKADLVKGSRYLRGGQHLAMPFQRTLGTRAYSFLFSVLSRHKVTDGSCGIRAATARLLRDERIDLAQPWLDRYELEPYLLYKALRLGFRVMEVPITIEYPRDRSQPYSKMRAIVDWWSVFRPVLFLAFGIDRLLYGSQLKARQQQRPTK